MKKGAYHNTVVGSLIFAKEYVTLYKQIKVYVANSRGYPRCASLLDNENTLVFLRQFLRQTK